MKAHRRLLLLQKRIQDTLKIEVDRLVGELPDAIARYERSYREAFRRISRRPLRSSRRELTTRIRSADVTFVADYHTLAQAQRTALRLMQDSVRQNERWILGLEFVPSHRQGELDAFMAGTIDAPTFLERIHYREEWGFPWSHYAPLLEWARRAGVRVVALNRPREVPILSGAAGSEDLRERDRWAAGIITDLFSGDSARTGRLRMIVLYGELHLGSGHLPAFCDTVSRQSLGRSLEWLVVHQNQDSLYWKLARRGPEHLNDVLRLNRRNFHVISSTPWSKLQSLASWADAVGSGVELLAPSALSGMGETPRTDDDEFLCDLESDALSRMQAYGGAIADFLKLPPPEFDRVGVQSVYSADFVDGFSGDSRLTTLERRLLRSLVVRNLRFYFPRTGLAYLGTPTPNGAAELAAIILAKGDSPRAPFFGETTDSFFQSVMDQAFGFFGSLLVNPRRKCDLPEDHLQRYLDLKKSGEQPQECEARRLTLLGLEEQARFLSRGQRAETRRNLPQGRHGIAELAEQILSRRGADSREAWVSLWLCSRYLGKILGKLLHRAVLRGEVSVEQVRELAWQASDRRWRPAEVRYWEWVSIVASQSLPVSKKQNI